MSDKFINFSEPIRSSEALRKACVFKSFAAKEIILNEDDPGGSVYFILSGLVNITGFSARGREIWFNRLGPGEIFGEMALLLDGYRTASVVAVEPTETAILSNTAFLDLLAENADISLWLLRELAKRLEQTTHKLYERVALNLSERLCVYLLEHCSGKPQPDGSYKITPPIVVAQLARQLNTDRENISRAISELAKEGIVRRDGRELYVLNPDRLEEKIDV